MAARQYSDERSYGRRTVYRAAGLLLGAVFLGGCTQKESKTACGGDDLECLMNHLFVIEGRSGDGGAGSGGGGPVQLFPIGRSVPDAASESSSAPRVTVTVHFTGDGPPPGGVPVYTQASELFIYQFDWTDPNGSRPSFFFGIRPRRNPTRTGICRPGRVGACCGGTVSPASANTQPCIRAPRGTRSNPDHRSSGTVTFGIGFNELVSDPQSYVLEITSASAPGGRDPVDLLAEKSQDPLPDVGPTAEVPIEIRPEAPASQPPTPSKSCFTITRSTIGSCATGDYCSATQAECRRSFQQVQAICVCHLCTGSVSYGPNPCP